MMKPPSKPGHPIYFVLPKPAKRTPTLANREPPPLPLRFFNAPRPGDQRQLAVVHAPAAAHQLRLDGALRLGEAKPRGADGTFLELALGRQKNRARTRLVGLQSLWTAWHKQKRQRGICLEEVPI